MGLRKKIIKNCLIFGLLKCSSTLKNENCDYSKPNYSSFLQDDLRLINKMH